MRKLWFLATLPVLVIGCQEGPGKEAPVPEKQDTPAQLPPPQTAQPSPPGAARPAGQAQTVTGMGAPSGSLVACRPGAEVEETASRLVQLADANNDGRVSKDEAQALTNFVVGGFFFRADTDGDGAVSPEEGKRARIDFMQQNPEIASLFRSVRGATGKSPFATLAKIVDVEYGKPLTFAEARDAARSAVNDLYGVADADKDGVITLAEARSTAWEGTRLLGRAAFQAADGDNNGNLSPAELQAALQPSIDAAFKMADTNNDGKLTQEEAAVAMGQVARLVGIQPSDKGAQPPDKK